MYWQSHEPITQSKSYYFRRINMSGSGGGSTWGDGDDFQCNRLKFEAQIATPQPDAITQIKEKDQLTVDLMMQDKTPIVVLKKGELLIGGLAGGMVQKLRECLLKNARFKATVIKIDGAQITVLVEPA
jgi:hypothetical protein